MLELSKAINIAIGCVIASGLDNNSKKEVIDTLRNVEEEHSSALRFLEIAKKSPLDAYQAKEVEEC